MEPDLQFYTVEEFSEIFRVSKRAITKAIQCGRIRAFKIGNSRKFPYRIPKSEFYRIQSVGMYEINPTLENNDSCQR